MPSRGDAWTQGMPAALTAAIPGDHMLPSAAPPDSISSADSASVSQKPAKWPARFLAVRNSASRSISARVMFPLSPKRRTPSASMASAASIAPTCGTRINIARPANSSLSRSAQLSIARPVRSGS